jgi:hypothetical protein
MYLGRTYTTNIYDHLYSTVYRIMYYLPRPQTYPMDSRIAMINIEAYHYRQKTDNGKFLPNRVSGSTPAVLLD